LGPGGIGKTRLALAAAEAQLNGQPTQRTPAFPQGIFFVGLARLDTADLLVPTIATALDFRFYEGSEPKEQLLGYLRRKKLLLVLDNFEHLLAGVGLVDEILTIAPGIKLLVTSREKLNRQAEQLFPIGGLALPEEDMAVDTEVTGYDAIQLFLQSAHRTRPDFALTAENESDVLRICRLVEGMPLGIVLAAAWLEMLTPQDIVAEMGRDLDFLATEMGDVPERQRSLRAVFNHSWRLLSEREQAVFRQLSVFRGGCTREAAEVITGATLRDLQSLVNKSLLFRAASGRYLIHELIRQFAAEKLAEKPDEETAVRDRHSVYYCAFLHKHTENWHTSRQLETLAAVTREADNAQPALRWALEQKEWQRLVQAVDSWGWFLDWQGRFADGEAFCRTIVEQAERQSGEKAVSPDCLRLQAKALVWLGRFTVDNGAAVRRFQQSLTLLEQLELARQDTRQEKAFVLASETWKLSDPDLERLLIEQSLALYRELGNQWGIAQGLSAHSHVDWRTGNHDSGLARAQAALTIHQGRGDRRGQAICIAMLARIHKTLGHLGEAERLKREALRLVQQIGERSRLAHRHAALAHTLLWQGKFAEAQQLAWESVAICRDLGHRAAEGWARYCLSETLLHSGQYQPARRQAASGLFVGSRDDEASLYEVLGQLALVESSYVEAQAAFAKSGEILRENQYRPFDFSLAGLGYTACRQGQLQDAHRHLVEALASALAVKTYGPTLFALPAVALLLAQTGDAARAVEIWALARCHPFVGNSKWFEDVAGRELEALAASLPPEVAEAAWERGRALDLWETAAVLLAELEGNDNN
jgi:predicted ATPase